MATQAENKNTTFLVEGMHCSSCAIAITKALKRREGIVFNF
jgi:copper chaperone CopZ